MVIGGKKKWASELKTNLRRFTRLNIFWGDNIDFKPVTLLKHMNLLNESVFGPEPEQEDNLKNTL